MKIKILSILVSCFFVLQTFAQHDPKVDSIIREGRLLFRTEMANWRGSDVLFKRFPLKSTETGGYFSYAEGKQIKSVFFSEGRKPRPLAVISFDSTFNVSTAVIDSSQRTFTVKEREYYELRKTALEIANNDTLFKVYENTRLNLVPIIDQHGKRVYFLTGPSVSGVVIFGNDYLLKFDQNNRLLEKKALHNNILPFYYKEDDIASIHYHSAEAGAYITATDICTLLLYERFTSWRQHVVASGNIVSIWNCGSEELTVMSRTDWDHIMEEKKLKQ